MPTGLPPAKRTYSHPISLMSVSTSLYDPRVYCRGVSQSRTLRLTNKFVPVQPECLLPPTSGVVVGQRLLIAKGWVKQTAEWAKAKLPKPRARLTSQPLYEPVPDPVVAPGHRLAPATEPTESVRATRPACVPAHRGSSPDQCFP